MTDKQTTTAAPPHSHPPSWKQPRGLSHSSTYGALFSPPFCSQPFVPPAAPHLSPSSDFKSDCNFFSWDSISPHVDLSIGATIPSTQPSSGAHYSFERGLSSALGTAVFAEEAAYVTESARLEKAKAGLGHTTRRRARREGLGLRACNIGGVDDSDADAGHVGERWDLGGESEEDVEVEKDWESITLASWRGADNSHLDGDVTAAQAASGIDVQGIPWESLPVSREDYRATRIRENTKKDTNDHSDGLKGVLKEPRRGGNFYNFFRNTRKVKCTIVHFQLRNLAWATSSHDVYVMHDASVVHWDAAKQRKAQVMDLSGGVTGNGLGMVQISTMIAQGDLIVAGGFYGEVVAKNVSTGTVLHNKRITYDENAITNAIDMYDNCMMTSSNDCFVRCFDVHTFTEKNAFKFDAPVNHATRQPDGKLVIVAGDDKLIHVIDGENGDRVAQLHGHEHFSFATAWHPNGRMFATGSQDRMCRVWDVRNMSKSITVLGAQLGAIRSVRFSSCGSFLVMAEPRDFVHIYDVNRGEFDTCQEIDLFGEIAGIALTPNAEGLFVAISDRTYCSLLEYERKSNAAMADLLF